MEAVSAGKGDRVDQQAIEDKIEIGELLVGYARGVDSKDWDQWRLVFAPDACADYSSAGSAADSRDEVAAWLAQS
jgi:3-phenylpropionate/cinnamic acid dioxygenase small subunit